MLFYESFFFVFFDLVFFILKGLLVSLLFLLDGMFENRDRFKVEWKWIVVGIVFVDFEEFSMLDNCKIVVLEDWSKCVLYKLYLMYDVV